MKMSCNKRLSNSLFSLVLCTLGRGAGLRRLLTSVVDQELGRSAVEIILVDQNPDNRHTGLLLEFANRLNIIHIRAHPGLSRARNIGLARVSGMIVAFPDDDCWYPEGHLSRVADHLENENCDGLTCRCCDEEGRLAAGGEDRHFGKVTKWNVWARGVSATLFLKRHVIEKVGTFDENLGLGACSGYQSGEETDYLLRALRDGLRIMYDPDLSVYHPLPIDSRRPGAIKKSWDYGLGMGRVLAKHQYNIIQVSWFVLVPLIGAGKAWCFGDRPLARVRATRAFARYNGWRGSPVQRRIPPPWPLM